MAESSSIVIAKKTGAEIAADEILAKLASLVDDNGNKIFKSVELGMFFPKDDPLDKDSMPAARLWLGDGEGEVDNVQFSVSEEERTFGLYIYNYAFAKNANGESPDIVRECDRLKQLVQNNLRRPDVSGVGLEIQNKAIWYFSNPQRVITKTGNVLRRFDKNYTLPRGWFTIEILFDIVATNTGV